jgi:hypothetical protein
MNNEYEEYCQWLLTTHEITPTQKFLGVLYIDEIVALRDEIVGRRGETEYVKLLKEEGRWESEKDNILRKYGVITFDEWKTDKLLK